MKRPASGLVATTSSQSMRWDTRAFRHKTPNIDRLAAEGQQWTSFYSSGATCVPSRRGLMTGRHPVLMGNANLVAARDKLMAAMLKRHGYRTAILGKWHLAGYPNDFTASPMHPLECGFDHHYGTPGSNDVPAPKGKVRNRELFDTCDRFTFQVPVTLVDRRNTPC